MAEDPKFEKLVRKGMAQDMKAMRNAPYNLSFGDKVVRMGPHNTRGLNPADPATKVIRKVNRATDRTALKSTALDRELRVGHIKLVENELMRTGKVLVKGLPVVALGVDLAGRIKKARKQARKQEN